MKTKMNLARGGASTSKKLLAAFAVLAVMFAAFAVVIPAIDDADADAVTAAHKYELTDKIFFDAWEKPTADNGLKGKAVALDVTKTGNNFVFDGFVTAGMDTNGTAVGDTNSAWAYLVITGLDTNEITITGTNPALAEITKGASTTINDKATGSYAFPIPRAGSGADATVTLKIGDATYTFDFSKVSTATNAAALASGTGVFAGKYTVSDSTKLELNGYTGKDLFYGVTEVTLKGTNTINAYGNADLGHGEGSYAIKAKDNSALTVKAGAEDASLTINQHADAFTVYSAGALTIGDYLNGVKTTTMTIDGGNRGLYSGTSIALCNSVVTISVSEKGIRTTGNASPGTLAMTNSTANVDLKTENKHVNGEESDDRFGVKVTALGTISADSTLNTDGLRLKTAPTQAIQGKIIIDNYEQNPSAKMTPLIAGFYSDVAVTTEGVFAKRTADISTGGIYLINGAEAYNITVQGAKGEVVGETSSDSAEVNKALKNDKTADVTYTGTTGDFLVPEGKTLTLVAGSAYNGTIKTGSDAANQSVKFTGFTGTVKIAKGSVQITDGAISAGSIEVKGDTTVVIDNVTITGNVTFSGEGTVVIKAGKTMTVEGAAGATNYTGLTIGPNVTVEVYGKLLKSGTGAIVNNGKLVQMSGGFIDDKFTTPTSTTLTVNNVSYTESDMKEIKVSGDTEKDLSFSEKQLVTVLDAGLNIYNKVTVAGKLVVPAGAKLTIMADGELELKNSAELVIEGTLEIEEKDTSVAGSVDGKLNVIKGTVTVSGSIVNNGVIAVGTSADHSTGVLIIAQDGVVTVGENGKITTDVRGKVVVDKSATLDVKGLIAGSNIYNAGTVTIGDLDEPPSTRPPTEQPSMSSATPSLPTLPQTSSSPMPEWSSPPTATPERPSRSPSRP